MIFHLSYKFKNGNQSISYWTPEDQCSVKYFDIEHADNNCLDLLTQVADHSERIFFGKTNLKSAFHVLPGKISEIFLLILKAVNPESSESSYFVDKSMPFGARMSCRNFQHFSNALRHIVECLKGINRTITNYLDDFLFMHYLCRMCNELLETFLRVCEAINFPVAIEKTVWAAEIVEFLGVLLNGKVFTICVPEDKVNKALHQLGRIVDGKNSPVKG